MPPRRCCGCPAPTGSNALTHEMLDELTAGLREAVSSEQARAVVLTGAGRAFCAGVDIAGAAERGRSEPSPARRYVRQEHFADTIRSVRNCRLPVIAAVNGPAAGAGMALALASDIRIAAHGARFLIGAPRLALSAGECGISWLLPRIIGPGRAFEIMLTNREIPAAEAAEIGLVTQLTEPENLIAATLAVAAEIARNSPFGGNHDEEGRVGRASTSASMPQSRAGEPDPDARRTWPPTTRPRRDRGLPGETGTALAGTMSSRTGSLWSGSPGATWAEMVARQPGRTWRSSGPPGRGTANGEPGTIGAASWRPGGTEAT